MSSAVQDQAPITTPASVPPPAQNPTAHPDSSSPSAKRRRGGRRTTNPEISAEERKRQRVLKNRESAMRSLAKKAEYSAQLEKRHSDAQARHDLAIDSLQSLLSTAAALKPLLAKLPPKASPALARADAIIMRASALLSDQQTVSLPAAEAPHECHPRPPLPMPADAALRKHPT